MEPIMSKNKTDSAPEMDVEEGELSDEEENQTTAPVRNEKSIISPNNNHHGQRKSNSRDREKLKNEESRSSKKRKHDSPAHIELNKDEEKLSDVQSFLKKRKQELAEKVKNQLRLVGIEAKVGSGSESDPDCIKPDTVERRRNNSRRRNSKSDKTGPPKYYDLDKIEDPTETMISNWASKGKPTPSSKAASSKAGESALACEEALASKILSPPVDAIVADTLEEYYKPSGDVVAGMGSDGDRDYRIQKAESSAAPASGDQDYRAKPSGDIDYRRRRRSDENAPSGGIADPSATPASFSGGDALSDDHGGYMDGESSPPSRSHRRSGAPTTGSSAAAMANEFGDIDERRDAAASSGYHRRGTGRRSSPGGYRQRRFDDEPISESEDEFHGDGGGRRGFRGRRRSPPMRRRGGGRGDHHGGFRELRTVVCKYYRDGFCREGDSCNFSHDIEPPPRDRIERINHNRIKIELCRFYKLGYCRNGRQCTFMHGDFPCKDFHKSGDCKEGDQCRFSHDPLNDMTRPLFERMLKEDEFFPKNNIATSNANDVLPTKRKVLLGEPPQQGDKNPMPPTNGPYGSMNRSGLESYYSSPQHPAASTSYNADGNASGYTIPYDSSQAPQPFYHHNSGTAPVPHASAIFYPQAQQQQASLTMSDDSGVHATGLLTSTPAKAPGVAVDITSMLRQIKAEVKGHHDVIDESPASPEPSRDDFNVTPLRQTTVRVVDYKLIAFDLPPRDYAYQQYLLNVSISDPKLGNDPRIKKMLTNQFDAVSDMISSSGVPTVPKSEPHAQYQHVDQRGAIVIGMQQPHPGTTTPQQNRMLTRDPRLKPSDELSPNSNPQQLQPPPFMAPPYNMPPMMPPVPPAAPSFLLPTPTQAPMLLPPMPPVPPQLPFATPTTTIAAMDMGMGSGGYPQPSPYFAPGVAMNGDAAGGPARWMPQVAYQANGPSQRFVSNVAPQATTNNDDDMNGGAENIRPRRPSRSSLTKRSPPGSSGGATGFYGTGAIAAATPSSVAASPLPLIATMTKAQVRRSSPSSDDEPLATLGDAQPAVSLREKRKDLQYESPLNNAAAATGGSGDESTTAATVAPAATLRYANLKIKKKGAVEI